MSEDNPVSETTTTKAVSKRVRFEVFKRDKFTCQYCGCAAPDVILHVDHIEPKSKGGSNNPLNLLTSCSSCNSGKGARLLSDESAIQKQKAMLDALQERREQIEMMLEWQRGLQGLADDEVAQLAEFVSERLGWNLNANGLNNLRKWSRKFSSPELIEAIGIAADHYLELRGTAANPSITQASFERAFNALPGICANRRQVAQNPNQAIVQHVANVARKRFPDLHPQRLAMLRKDILFAIEENSVSRDVLFALLFESRSITSFETKLANLNATTENE